MTTEELKQEIDGMSYESLLSKWRFAPIGDPMFVEEVGNYYKKVMKEKQQVLGPAEVVAASKSVGWDAA